MKQKINICIPAGGIGKRFVDAGYETLKPFIKIKDKTMFEHVILNLTPSSYEFDFFIIINEKVKEKYAYEINDLAKKYAINFLYLNEQTKGPTDTVLKFAKIFDPNIPLLLANCDQLIDVDIDDFLNHSLHYDGSLMLFDKENSKKFSFAKIEQDLVVNVAAKDNISEFAVCGWYF